MSGVLQAKDVRDLGSATTSNTLGVRLHRIEGEDEEVLRERLDFAEADLGRALLLAMAVNRLLVRKRAVTPAEIARVAEKLDLADGRADGKLDPGAVRPADIDNREASP